MATGIKDRVAILGMGCSKFGERWDASPEDLMVEAYGEAMVDAWHRTGATRRRSASTTSTTSVSDAAARRWRSLYDCQISASREVQNFCAGGSEAVRAAVYAVAAGACDIALALGVEKLKDTGYGGLPVATVGTYIRSGTRTQLRRPTSRSLPPHIAVSTGSIPLCSSAPSRMFRLKATPMPHTIPRRICRRRSLRNKRCMRLSLLDTRSFRLLRRF